MQTATLIGTSNVIGGGVYRLSNGYDYMGENRTHVVVVTMLSNRPGWVYETVVMPYDEYSDTVSFGILLSQTEGTDHIAALNAMGVAVTQ